ncbi:hypothetical protein GCM10027589_14790 [Actinocorallia lasiicapitis]
MGATAGDGVEGGGELAAEEAFLVDLGRLLLSCSGEGIAFVREPLKGAARQLGLRAEALVLPDQMMLQVEGGGRSSTHVILAEPGIRLDKLERAKSLVDRLHEGMPLERAQVEMAEILRSRPLYPGWLRMVGVVLFSVGFAPSVVPSLREFGAALLLGLVMGVLFVLAEGRRWEPMLPFVGGFVVGVVALTVLAGPAARTGPVLLMIPALFVVIPGDFLSAAAGELAVGRISAGATRLIWSVFMLAELVIGVYLAAIVTGRGEQALFEGSGQGSLPFWVVVVAWIPFSAGLAFAFNARARNIPLIAVSSIGTFLAFAATRHFTNDLVATLVAAALLGEGAAWAARRPSMPPRLVLLAGGFFVLTVGSLGLRGLTDILGGEPLDGARQLADFLLLFPAVAGGLVAGFLVAGEPFASGVL